MSPQNGMRTNPLLEKSTLPNQAPPFDRIQESDYLPAVEAAIIEARANIAAIKNCLARPDFENTIVALETASETLGAVSGVFYNQLSAAGTDALQELAEKEIGPKTSAFSSDVSMDPDLFARVKAVYDDRATLNLTPEQQTVLEDTYKDFVRGGALLPEKKKARLREINERLAVLGPQFSENVKKCVENFELLITDKAELAGLPKSALDGARAAAQEKGHEDGWLFTLDAPSYVPFIQYADNRSLREKLWMAFNSRAWGGQFDNAPLVLETVRLRHESAKLLGYKSHAHYVLEERMAQTPETVKAFLGKLKKAYKRAAKKDLKTLQKFAAKTGGPVELMPWDVSYYAEKLKESKYKFTSEDLRPYFPLEKVLDGCFAHFSKLLNLKFTANAAYPLWHPDVKAYDVHDQTSGRFMGTLYADFFPRKGKSDGAWMTSYREQGLFGGKIERPVSAIVCNFTKPTKENPSLLTHDEVTTLFHEMGHAIHGTLSDVTYPSVAGTNVRWDFVELPSQVQENWAYTKETLDMISSHHETGEKIPDELVEKLNKAKNFMAGWGGLRQVSMATVDMAWHTGNRSKVTDVAAFEDKAAASTRLFPRLAGPASTSFSHLFNGGYSAGYYSYHWAEALDADTFEFFLERGLYDRETAESYKREILSKGGSENPALLYRRFRGRDADPDALLRRQGLLSAPKNRKPKP